MSFMPEVNPAIEEMAERLYTAWASRPRSQWGKLTPINKVRWYRVAVAALQANFEVSHPLDLTDWDCPEDAVYDEHLREEASPA